MKRIDRTGDMCTRAKLTLVQQDDGDIILTVCEPAYDDSGIRRVSVEFCEPVYGGGASPKVHAALVVLLAAMEQEERDE